MKLEELLENLKNVHEIDYDQKIIQELYDELSQDPIGIALFEFATTIDSIRRDYRTKTYSLFEHINKLFLYGYDSDYYKTIHDIYDFLYSLSIPKRLNHIINKANLTDWLVLNNGEDNYKNDIRKLVKVTENKYKIKATPELADYNKYIAVCDYIISLLVSDEYAESEEFKDYIMNITGVTESDTRTA